MLHDNVIFILVRPNYLGNIGSVTRVLKNFAFSKLRLVNPPKNYKDAEARKMSVGAFDILKHSEVFEDFGSALKDVSVAIGTTSGQQRENPPVPIRAISSILNLSSNNKIAIVFGDERDGLQRDELERCHRTITIPTNPEFPALNMSQAVGICAYEIDRVLSSVGPSDVELPSGESDDRLFEDIAEMLEDIKFARTFNKHRILAELRSFYQRAVPTQREQDLLRSVVRKIRDTNK